MGGEDGHGHKEEKARSCMSDKVRYNQVITSDKMGDENERGGRVSGDTEGWEAGGLSEPL